jgi:hypothetical protein
MVDSFARKGGFIPVLDGAKVFDPPRKGAALDGPCFINGAPLVFEKGAVAIRLIGERKLSVDKAGIFFCKFAGREPSVLSQVDKIGVGQEDIAGRACATFAAAGALKF